MCRTVKGRQRLGRSSFEELEELDDAIEKGSVDEYLLEAQVHKPEDLAELEKIDVSGPLLLKQYSLP